MDFPPCCNARAPFSSTGAEEEGEVSGHSRNCIPHRFTHPGVFEGWDRFNKGTEILNTIISADPLARIPRKCGASVFFVGDFSEDKRMVEE